jgi:hypothetical protein
MAYRGWENQRKNMEFSFGKFIGKPDAERRIVMFGLWSSGL